LELSNLPQITFAEKSAQEIESNIITTYEAIAGKTLFPGDPVRLFLQSIAALIIQQRVLIDYSAKQNLLAYAEGDVLPHIGVLVGTDKLEAAPAITTLRFALSAVQSNPVSIPTGTRVTPGKNIMFATTEDITVLAGQLTVDIPAECTEAGIIGNDFTPGQINKLVDPFQWFGSVTNITTSAGGADIESDDAYRERIHQAPEQFSTAGPSGAYEYWAKTASQLIIDVSVYSPSPGVIEIRPLLSGGEIPGDEIIDAVLNICSDTKIRPLTDNVLVLAPEQISYDLNLSYWIGQKNAALALSIQQAVTMAINEYIIWQKSKLGRDLNPSELTARIMAAGAKRVNIVSPIYTDVSQSQVAIADQVTITYGGLEDGN
jgi:phage-related baseplate assembly protein